MKIKLTYLLFVFFFLFLCIPQKAVCTIASSIKKVNKPNFVKQNNLPINFAIYDVLNDDEDDKASSKSRRKISKLLVPANIKFHGFQTIASSSYQVIPRFTNLSYKNYWHPSLLLKSSLSIAIGCLRI